MEPLYCAFRVLKFTRPFTPNACSPKKLGEAAPRLDGRMLGAMQVTIIGSGNIGGGNGLGGGGFGGVGISFGVGDLAFDVMLEAL